MWDEKRYNNFLKELYKHQDLSYKEFSKSLLPKNYKYNYIGVRLPILRKMAKTISKEDYISFININKHNTFEEIMIHGFIIGYIKRDINTVINLYKEFIKYIDNWSICDSTSNNLKIIHKYPKEGLKLVKWCLNHKKTYYKRVGYVLLLNYFIKEDQLDYIFESCNNKNTDEYYINMAVAWLIAECYIKYPEKTILYIKDNKLDKWTHNKAIQKIKESNRIDSQTKQTLNRYKQID